MDKFLESLFNYIVNIFLLIIYIVVFIFYSIGIKTLNAELIAKENAGWGAVKLLSYNNYSPIYYFLFAIILGLSGALLISLSVMTLKGSYSNIYDMIIGIVIISILVLLLISVIKLIMIPILRLIFTVVVMGVVILGGTK